MNTRDEFDPEFIKSVISHMNKDHADACLSIVKAFSEQTSAISAELRDLNRHSLFFKVETLAPTQPVNQAPATIDVDVKIDFANPLRNELQIRGALVGISNHARDLLAK